MVYFLSRLGHVVLGALLAVVLAPASLSAGPGITLHPLVGTFDPGGFYWGIAVRSRMDPAVVTLGFRRNNLRGDEWRLSYHHPLVGGWAYRFDLALNEKHDTFDIDRLPELAFAHSPVRLGALPISMAFEVSGAALFERQSARRTFRTRALLALVTDPLRMGPLPVDFTWAMGASWYSAGAPQYSRALTVGSTVPVTSSATFRLAYTRRWVDGASPLGFDRLDPLNEVAGTVTQAIGGNFSVSGTLVYGFLIRDVKDRDYVLIYTPPGGRPIRLIWHDVTRKWEVQVRQAF